MNTFKKYLLLKESNKSYKNYPTLKTCFGSHSKSINESFDDLSGHFDKDLSDKIHSEYAPIKSTSEHIKDYTRSSYPINDALHNYNHGKVIPSKHKETISNLDSVMNSHSTKQDFSVYTGIPESPTDKFNSVDKAAKLHLPAYTSTSTELNQAVKFTDPHSTSAEDSAHYSHHFGNDLKSDRIRHVLQIHVPKGSHAASVRSVSFSPQENEVLLHRGMVIHVDPKPTHIKDKNLMIWHSKIVDHDPTPLEE